MKLDKTFIKKENDWWKFRNMDDDLIANRGGSAATIAESKQKKCLKC
jgi:hypothetical protein